MRNFIKNLMSLILLLSVMPAHALQVQKKRDSGDQRIHEFNYGPAMPSSGTIMDLSDCELDGGPKKKLERDNGLVAEPLCLDLRSKESGGWKLITDAFAQQNYLKKDLEACACVKRTWINDVVNHMTGNFLNEDERDLEILKANIKQKRERLQNLMNGMSIQSLIFNIDPAKTAAKPALPEKNKNGINFSKGIIKATRQLGRASRIKKAEVVKLAQSLDQNYEAQTVKLDQTPVKGSCISMHTFHALSQSPQEGFGEFFPRKFQDSDWDIDALNMKYDDVSRKMSAGSANVTLDDINKLKVRITFLQRNPMISNLFSSRNAAASTGKNKLFKILEEKFSENAGVKGRNKINPGSAHKNYLNSLKALYSEPEIAAIVDAESKNRLEQELKKDDVTNLALPLSRRALENKFEAMTGESVKDCRNSRTRIVSKCVLKMSQYCRFIEKAKDVPNHKVFALNSASKLLAEENAINTDSDPEKNMDFQNKSDLICKRARLPRDGHGEPKTYEEFENMHCKNPKDQPECNPEFREALVSMYLSRYKTADGEANEEAEVEGILYSTPATEKFSRTTAGKMITNKDYNNLSSPIGQVTSLNETKTEADSIPQEEMKLPGNLGSPGMNQFNNVTNATVAPSSLNNDTEKNGNTFNSDNNKQRNEEVSENERLRQELASARADRDKAIKEKDETALEKMDKKFRALEEKFNSKLAEDAKSSSKKRKGKKENRDSEFEDDEQAIADDENGEDNDSRPTKKTNRKPASSPLAENQVNNFSVPNNYVFPSAPNNTQKPSPSNSSSINSFTGAAAQVSGNSISNNALLVKYGIEMKYTMAPELEKLPSSKEINGDAPVLPIVVKASDYKSLLNNDEKSFKAMVALFEQNAKTGPEAVVQFSVTAAEGDSAPLYFFAIREGSKVVFRPVRYTKAADLSNVLREETQGRAPANKKD